MNISTWVFFVMVLLSKIVVAFDFGNPQGLPPNIGRFIGVKNVGDSILDVSPESYTAHLSVYCGGGLKGITPLIVDSSYVGQFCYTEKYGAGSVPSYAYTFAVSNSYKSKSDTVVTKITDTITDIDTIIVKSIDSIIVRKTDTVTIIDTLVYHDTSNIVTTYPIIIMDTINNYIHDTISICEYNKIAVWSQRLYRSKGKSDQTQAITLETEPGISPSVEFETSENVQVNVYIYDNLGTYVTSGRFEILPSRHKQYLKFNGLSKYGSEVVDGVFLMRVITHHNGNTSNTVYSVGISNK